MLVELTATESGSRAGGTYRRWFMSAGMDLIVWYEEGNEVGFQLCYDKESDEKALTWRRGSVPVHSAISAGEDAGMKYKETPIHTYGDEPDHEYIRRCFLAESPGLPEALRTLVLSILNRDQHEEHPT